MKVPDYLRQAVGDMTPTQIHRAINEAVTPTRIRFYLSDAARKPWGDAMKASTVRAFAEGIPSVDPRALWLANGVSCQLFEDRTPPLAQLIPDRARVLGPDAISRILATTQAEIEQATQAAELEELRAENARLQSRITELEGAGTGRRPRKSVGG